MSCAFAPARRRGEAVRFPLGAYTQLWEAGPCPTGFNVTGEESQGTAQEEVEMDAGKSDIDEPPAA